MTQKEYRLFWEESARGRGLVLELFRSGFQIYYRSVPVNPKTATDDQLRDLPVLFKGKEVVAKGAENILLYVRQLMREETTPR